MSAVNDDAVRRWHAGQRAAARRALALLTEEPPPEPAESFARAMELCALVDVGPADEIRLQEEAASRAAWAKVRAWAASRAASR
jgi:hypothetical protein